jgi:hypothetical protein
VGVPTIKTGPMTVEEYFAFTDTRRDNEKWELIDGEPILNASPSNLHQRILGNLIVAIGSFERQHPQSWEAIPGIGVRCLNSACRSQTFSSFRPERRGAIRTVQRPGTSWQRSRSFHRRRWIVTCAGRKQPTRVCHRLSTMSSLRRMRWMSSCSPAIRDLQSGAITRSPIRSNYRRSASRCRCRKSTTTPGLNRIAGSILFVRGPSA